ncbi:MAG: RNA-binding transcriptional accessory protein [Erysipelotrichales bacterium]|nr:RNA-binding transcriptional accessory protein [Erysipelotrichales bacterium]
MDIIKTLSEELDISEKQVNAVIGLLDEGNTIPFIARYRKEVTGSLDDEILRKFYTRLEYVKSFNERLETIIKSITEQGFMTDEIMASLENAKTLTELEDIYRPFKPKKKTRASIAKEKGLEPLAKTILELNKDIIVFEEAKKYINEEKKVLTEEDAINGAKDIIAELVSDDPKYRKQIRDFMYKTGKVKTIEDKPDEKNTFEMYKDYEEAINRIPPHRILAINRGENMKCLKVTLVIDEVEALSRIKSKMVTRDCDSSKYVLEAIDDAYKRLIFPSLENELRNELTEKAEETSMGVFKENLKQLLLVAPVEHKIVLGFDPAFRTGCKLAVVDERGKVLATSVVYPTEPHNRIEEAKKTIKLLISKYNINMIALGNGTASRESEAFLRGLLSELDTKVDYVIVNEAGASVYSASPLGTKEFPTFDVALRSAVSLARRLQDPLAELVKIDPKAIGVGQYQHDMNQKKLGEVLGGVVETCVNNVGVDLNTASPSLLEYVSGISSTLAQSIVKYREENGPFKNREDLLKVNKLGPKAYEQCAGFLRIRNGYPLDNTAVHPESYHFAIALLKELKHSVEDLNDESLKEMLKDLNVEEYAKRLNVGAPTLSDIVEELIKPGRDPRLDVEVAELRHDVIDIKDLQVGMVLKGTVRNIMDFGVFVDIGVHQDGLVHISELSNKFVKHPLDVVNINQIVNVKVISVDVAKKRIGLSIKQAE